MGEKLEFITTLFLIIGGLMLGFEGALWVSDIILEIFLRIFIGNWPSNFRLSPFELSSLAIGALCFIIGLSALYWTVKTIKQIINRKKK